MQNCQKKFNSPRACILRSTAATGATGAGAGANAGADAGADGYVFYVVPYFVISIEAKKIKNKKEGLTMVKHYFSAWKNGLDAENKRIAEYLRQKHQGRYIPILHPDMIKWVCGNICYTLGFLQGLIFK